MKRNKSSVPLRTCVICGRKGEKMTMIRFTAAKNPVVDVKGMQAGRGRYVCRDLVCIDMFRNSKMAFKALRSGEISKEVLHAFADELEQVVKS